MFILEHNGDMNSIVVVNAKMQCLHAAHLMHCKIQLPWLASMVVYTNKTVL